MKANAKQKPRISAAKLDRIFDEGKQDVVQYFDLENARRPNLEAKRVNVDFPNWMVEKLDREARRVGVTRQALIKLWLSDKLERIA